VKVSRLASRGGGTGLALYLGAQARAGFLGRESQGVVAEGKMKKGGDA